MGDSASGGGISHMISWSGDPALAVGSEGPVVAWSQNTGGEDSEIYVRRWDGAAWVEMGGSASGGGISHMPGRSGDPALAVGSDGPVVAWSQETDGDDPEIYVRRWDGADWVEMGAGSASGGGISDNDSGSLHPSLAVGPDGPIVAWEDYDDGDDGEIYVRGWDGSAWVEMGGSASGGGISDNDGWSESTTLAVGPDGPIVAWHYISDDNVEIYARRWDGSAWVGMNGSASGGGISDNDIMSLDPSLAVGPYGPIIAWHDYSDGDSEIYVRAFLECHALALDHTGNGSDPDPGLDHSIGCGLDQYLAGDLITLTANPAPGWHVAGWSGTDNDASKALTNTVTMPTGDHTVSVAYEENPFYLAFMAMVTNIPPPCFPGPNEREPNNGFTEAVANGHFCLDVEFLGRPTDEWDVFAFDVSAADTLTVRVENHRGQNALLQLHNSAQNLLEYDNNSADGFQVSRAVTPGRYFVSLFVKNPNVNETEQYRLKGMLLCTSFPNEQEPNNTQSGANGPLCNSRASTGLPTDAFDIFYFDVGQTADVTATLDNHAGSGVQLALHYQAITANPLDVDYIAADGFHVSAANAAPGRYYVVIYAATPGPATPYTLRAEWE